MCQHHAPATPSTTAQFFLATSLYTQKKNFLVNPLRINALKEQYEIHVVTDSLVCFIRAATVMANCIITPCYQSTYNMHKHAEFTAS